MQITCRAVLLFGLVFFTLTEAKYLRHRRVGPNQSAGQELTILPQGNVQTKPLWGAIVFTCQAGGLANPMIDPGLTWFDSEDREITQTHGRVYVERVSLLVLKLYITSIEHVDAGTYTCKGEINGAYNEAFSGLEIFQDITFEDAPSLQYEAIHTDALIKCIVDGQPLPTVSWRYNRRTIVTGGRYIMEPTGLTVMNITQDDDDYKYICRVEVVEDGRYAQTEITVRVKVPPTIDQPMGIQEGFAGNEMWLNCYGTGDSQPVFEFYKDNNQNPIYESYRVTIDRRAGRINFRPLIESDRGSYRCLAINEVGSAEDIGFLDVKALPGPPASVSVRESNPTTVFLDVEPPVDDGGIPITGYRLEYELIVREVALDEPIKIENLRPQTQYVFRIRARNEVGAGASLDFSHRTESVRAPSALKLDPPPSIPEYAVEFDLSWENPETGGLAIVEYEFKHRAVDLNPDGTVNKPLEDWTRALRLDNPQQPIQSHVFTNLQPATNYEVKVRVRNDIGWSVSHPEYIFTTLDDEDENYVWYA